MSDEDASLAGRAKGGDREAFEELVRRHHPRVIGLCLSLLGERTAAEDAAQEAFLKAYESLEGWRGGSSFSTWLHRIASNVCLDALRRRARRPAASWEGLVEERGEALEALLKDPSDPAARVEAEDLLRRLLDELPADYRLVLTLREAQGLSYEEIAQAGGWSLDSVKARLRRARAAVEERLRHFFPPEDV